MKKLLGIVVLGLLLSGNAYAENVTYDLIKYRDKFGILLPNENLVLDSKNKEFTNSTRANNFKSYIKEYLTIRMECWHSEQVSGYTNGWTMQWMDCTYDGEKVLLNKYNLNSLNKISYDRYSKNFNYAHLYDRQLVSDPFNEDNWTSFVQKERRVIANTFQKMEYALEKKYMTKSPNNLKKCEEIGFKPGTDNFANCVLKLIELTALHERAVLESSSKNSIDVEMLQQQIDIQDQIAKEAKASRDQQAWGVLLGMTMGSGILDSSSGGLFSSSTVSCNKTGETTSGTNKICYYNCMGSTKTINVGSMQFCPININK